MNGIARASLRDLRRHRWQLGLSLLGIALGVAVVVAVDLANESARRAFRLSLDQLTGAATHQVSASAAALDEALDTRLRLAGWRRIAPVVEGHLRIGDETLQLVGLDVFAETRVRERALLRVQDPALAPLLTEPGTVLMTAGTAARLGLARGEPFTARAGGRERRLRLLGLLQVE